MLEILNGSLCRKGNRLFEIIFLGTSASAPSIHRGLSSQVVKHNEHRFLIDCGEGTQRQILQSGLGFKNLNKILITHSHLDHILGLAGLLSTYMRWEAIDSLDIYGGKAALERIHDLLYSVVLRGASSPMPIVFHDVNPGVIFEDDDFSVTAFPVIHRGPDCYGYRFEEKARRPFLAEKAEALGVPSGPLRRKLVQGESVVTPDGRTVTSEEVMGPYKMGTHFVHVGDVGVTENLVAACRGADALVIEATYLEEETDMAKQFGHLTARQAAELAVKAGVKQLYLTHISRRYREKDVQTEAQAVFPHTIVARDFDTYQIRRDEE
jgi:ribonuclease Z